MERTLLIVWTGWGAIIALLVGWLDQSPVAALAWLATGIVIGSLGPKLVGGLDTMVFDWYRRFWKDNERDKRIDQLLKRMLESDELTGLSDDESRYEQRLELVMKVAPESAEYHQLIEEDSFGDMLWMPLFVGLFHGILLGGIVGALAPLDPDVRVPAWQGAALGVVVGFVAVSFLAAIIFAVGVPMPKGLPLSTRLTRRAILAVSPLFVVPLAWHCLRYLTAQRIA